MINMVEFQNFKEISESFEYLENLIKENIEENIRERVFKIDARFHSHIELEVSPELREDVYVLTARIVYMMHSKPPILTFSHKSLGAVFKLDDMRNPFPQVEFFCKEFAETLNEYGKRQWGHKILDNVGKDVVKNILEKEN